MSPAPTTVEALAQADLLLLAARSVLPLGQRDADQPRAFDDLAARAGMPDLAGLLHDLADGAAAIDPDTLHAETTRLFEGPVACPINETGYVRRDKGGIIADICGFYLAFGFEPGRGGEKADHLVCELEFTGLLMVMLARAVESADEEHSQVSLAAARSFLDDHLVVWWAAFCRRLVEVTALPYFERVARFHDALREGLIERYALTTTGEPDPDEPDTGSPYECGMAGPEPLVELTVQSGSRDVDAPSAVGGRRA